MKEASSSASMTLFALDRLPMVNAGDDLASMIVDALHACGKELADDDVVVIAQKIVSKSENRLVDLATVTPSSEAVALAEETQKDPRIVQLILNESSRIVRTRPGLIIVEHRNGYIHANAGIDQSNVSDAKGEFCLLLPLDPDASALRIRERIAELTGKHPGIIINDSMGRAWRLGVIGTAIGVAGWPALIDQRGQADLFGRTLTSTVVGHADELAAAASILQGQAHEAHPVVIVSGLSRKGPNESARHLIRQSHEDLFR